MNSTGGAYIPANPSTQPAVSLSNMVTAYEQLVTRLHELRNNLSSQVDRIAGPQPKEVSASQAQPPDGGPMLQNLSRLGVLCNSICSSIEAELQRLDRAL